MIYVEQEELHVSNTFLVLKHQDNRYTLVLFREDSTMVRSVL